MIYRVKIVLFFITVIFFSITQCYADELKLDKDVVLQKTIQETGFKILNANNIERRVTFYYSPDNKVGSKVFVNPKNIYIYKGLFPFLDDENELAAILSTNIAYLEDKRTSFFKKFSVSFSPRKYEFKEDKKAVDYMVKAGYDPVALITVLNKITKENRWFDKIALLHNGSERCLNVYRYIYEKYPIYLSDNKYIENPYYQNFLNISQNDREKVKILQEEIIKINEKNSNKIYEKTVD